MHPRRSSRPSPSRRTEDPQAVPSEAITQPAKLLRIASMVRELLEETRQASLDEAGPQASGRDLPAVASGARRGRSPRTCRRSWPRWRLRWTRCRASPRSASRRRSWWDGSRDCSTGSRRRCSPSRRPRARSSRSSGAAGSPAGRSRSRRRPDGRAPRRAVPLAVPRPRAARPASGPARPVAATPSAPPASRWAMYTGISISSTTTTATTFTTGRFRGWRRLLKINFGIVSSLPARKFVTTISSNDSANASSAPAIDGVADRGERDVAERLPAVGAQVHRRLDQRGRRAPQPGDHVVVDTTTMQKVAWPTMIVSSPNEIAAALIGRVQRDRRHDPRERDRQHQQERDRVASEEPEPMDGERRQRCPARAPISRRDRRDLERVAPAPLRTSELAPRDAEPLRGEVLDRPRLPDAVVERVDHDDARGMYRNASANQVPASIMKRARRDSIRAPRTRRSAWRATGRWP